MNMMPMMGGAMNPMQGMLMGAIQNAIAPYLGGMTQPQNQPANYTPQPQGYDHMRAQSDQMHADEFARHLENYCCEVIEGRRAMPHKVKELFGVAWQGAREAVQEHREHAKPERDAEAEGELFWKGVDELRAVRHDAGKRAAVMDKNFHWASPVQKMVLTELASERSMEEHAKAINMSDSTFREHLTKLMRHEH